MLKMKIAYKYGAKSYGENGFVIMEAEVVEPKYSDKDEEELSGFYFQFEGPDHHIYQEGPFSIQLNCKRRGIEQLMKIYEEE